MRNIDELKQVWADMVEEVGAENVLETIALSKDEWKVMGAFFMENCLDADETGHQLFNAMIGHGVKKDG